MIDERHIAAWAAGHPWRLNEYVEQDLVICRAVVAIFSDPFLSARLVWKGGTALRKTDVDVGSMLRCWRSYRENAGEPKVGRSKIVANVEAKLADPDYLADLDNFLAPGVSFDPRSAWDNVKARIVDRI